METLWWYGEIQTVQDVETIMLPEFSNDNPIDNYLKKQFDKLYARLKNAGVNWENISSILDELNDIWESWKEKERLHKQAIHWAKCAIIQRNLSHPLWKLLSVPNNLLDEFVSFCGFNRKNIEEGEWSFLTNLFTKDSEKLKNHPLNIKYQELRKKWKTPLESIQLLPRWKLALQDEFQWFSVLPTCDEILQWSKMWNTQFCMWRVNTILWIIAINEWIEYLDKHFKYVEVIKDWLEDKEWEMVSREVRDELYLNDILNYEDPHQILAFVDDEGKETLIDPNLIALNQMWNRFSNINHVTKVYNWDISDIIYEIYFLNYLNSKFYKLNSTEEKMKIIDYVEGRNVEYWWIFTLIKWLIGYWEMIQDEKYSNEKFQELQQLAKEYPCIENTLAYQIYLNNWNPELMNKFIHEKYWPNFSWEDVKSQYWYE